MPVRQGASPRGLNLIARFLLRWLARAPQRSTSGFTLVELLVAIVVAALVITPLLGLAINLLQNDRQEQAKATSEQELQAAADYIARDLQQAIYVYDGIALARNSSSDANSSGIRDQIPPGSGAFGDCRIDNCAPVLVFWKRRPVANAVPISDNTVDCTKQANADECDDTFVYSLVAYYLISESGSLVDNANVWSSTARIARFEIHDGVRYAISANGQTAGSLILTNSSRLPRSPGFAFFNLNLPGTTLAGKMNRWRGQRNADDTGAEAYDISRSRMQVLVDYIDQSPASNTSPPAPEGLTTEDCPANTSSTDTTWTKAPDPTDLPNGSAATAPPAALNNDSFYACINSSENTARIYLRGNALARLRAINNPPNYSRGVSAYFPTARIEARGVGRLVQ